MILNGDCVDVLEDLPAAAYDSLITDPPAGIAFMGKDWDKDKGGRDAWIEWMTGVMKECLRVLKPGAHGFVWALPRTSHWTTTACENAGFEIRDVVMHVFGSGFPKSHNVSKAIDKAAGAKRKKVGDNPNHRGASQMRNPHTKSLGQDGSLTTPATPEAKQWDGWGTALKPAAEHWVLIRKPLAHKTVAKNVLAYGTGAINVDASRIEAKDPQLAEKYASVQNAPARENNIYGKDRRERTGSMAHPQGRFPANFIYSGEARDVLDEQSGACKTGTITKPPTAKDRMWRGKKPFVTASHKDNGGGASRFFYCAKASKSERNAGCEGMAEKDLARGNAAQTAVKRGETIEHKDASNGLGTTYKTTNHHPTVKAQRLMTYLIRMITPPKGKLLDPFVGSGSTAVAAVKLGHDFLGIEQSDEYCEIARRRLEFAKLEAKGQMSLL